MASTVRWAAAGGAAIALPVLAVWAAGSAEAAPTAPVPAPPTKALPAALDVMTPWQPQVSCDPVDKPGVRAFGDLMLATYRSGNYGVSRYCAADTSEHYDGRALDWMLSVNNPDQKAIADSVTAWLSANNGAMARRFGIQYIIWNKHMWREYDPGRGWAAYSGSDPHTSHVHFSFTWDGAMKRTSWWTGTPVTVPDVGPCRVYAGEYAPVYTSRNTTPCPVSLPAAPTSVHAVAVQGQSSPDIALAQKLLGITADGQFGGGTRAALLAWQRSHGVPVTGVLDKATWARLAPGAPVATTPTPTPATPTTYPTFRQGQSSPTIAIAQHALGVTADGAFGPVTFKALVAWQTSHGVPVTGVLDAATWARLVPAAGTATPAPQPAPKPAPKPAPAPATGGSSQAASGYPSIPAPTSAAGRTGYTAYKATVLHQGSTGAAVKVLQRALGGLSADGAFGPRTAAVLTAWQKAHHLPATGTTTRATWDALERRDFPLVQWWNTVLRNGSSGPAVVALQRALGVSADGKFGPLTERAVKEAQGRANLARTGVVATLTWRAIETRMHR
ncbi:peptidoglycan-binding domain-containing protein [Oryzihumus sp.]